MISPIFGALGLRKDAWRLGAESKSWVKKLSPGRRCLVDGENKTWFDGDQTLKNGDFTNQNGDMTKKMGIIGDLTRFHRQQCNSMD